MVIRKYPAGTKIKYVGHCLRCKGKIGKVVSVRENGYYITLPGSFCRVAGSNKKFICTWSEIEPVLVKNEQLLFEFALE